MNKLWGGKKLLLLLTIDKYKAKKLLYNILQNSYIKALLKLLIYILKSLIDKLLDILTKVNGARDNIYDQLSSLINIYNSTHSSSIGKHELDLTYLDILTTKPKLFTAKYYNSLPWDPDVVLPVDTFKSELLFRDLKDFLKKLYTNKLLDPLEALPPDKSNKLRG